MTENTGENPSTQEPTTKRLTKEERIQTVCGRLRDGKPCGNDAIIGFGACYDCMTEAEKKRIILESRSVARNYYSTTKSLSTDPIKAGRQLALLRKELKSYREGLVDGYRDFVDRYTPLKVDSIEKITALLGISLAACATGELSTKKITALAKACAVQLKALESLEVVNRLKEVEDHVISAGSVSLRPRASDFFTHAEAVRVIQNESNGKDRKAV